MTVQADKSLIVFEWSDFEQVVSDKEDLAWKDAEFEKGKFQVTKALGFECMSIFVDSKISTEDLHLLHSAGTKKILIRAAGFDMVDTIAAKKLGIEVWRVAKYSPNSIAEHAFALLLNIARRLNVERAHHQKFQNIRTVKSMGFTLQGKVLGLYGMGRIGTVVAKIAHGFDMKVQYCDVCESDLEFCNRMQDLSTLFATSDIVSIHVPLLPETKQAINWQVISKSKPGLILINTSRGDVVDSEAVLRGLDEGLLGGLGIDVWDSGKVDDLFDKHLLRDNVIQTHHTAFFTYEAVSEILSSTLQNWQGTGEAENQVQ